MGVGYQYPSNGRGYCEQFHVHEPFSTVREALEFSALLRQTRGTPDKEKLAYVNTAMTCSSFMTYNTSSSVAQALVSRLSNADVSALE